MQYKTVEIKPSFLRNGWKVRFAKSDGQDRVKGRKCTPNNLGFFHYWETIPDEDAFKQLKEHLIKRHREEISRLLLSLEKLETLESGLPIQEV